jgi:oligogalacturonide lyase
MEMPTVKPREISFVPRTYPDPLTRRKVTRLFPDRQNACHAYFTSTSYDAQGRLIISADIDGLNQLCRVDLRAGTLHLLTDLPDMEMQNYCVVPAKNIAIVKGAGSLDRVDLETGAIETIFKVPQGWNISTPTADAFGKKVAFAIRQDCPNLTATGKIYSGMAENFYMRPHSMVMTIDLETHAPAVVWGDVCWISHVLINPVDSETVVFCHEGGSLADHRLWLVGTRQTRKKHARCLYKERFEESLVHEYFCADGTLGVQYTEYDPSDAQVYSSKTLFNGVLFLKLDGTVAAKLKLPGRRSGHVQSNSNNTLIVSDGYHPTPDFDLAEGQKSLSLHRIDGTNLGVERLCCSGTSWKTQWSHPHPIFSPNDKQVLFSAEVDGVNSVYLVEV